MLSFDIIEDPWLDVVDDHGRLATLSLREVLTSAHLITRLSEPSPLTEIALLRFLIALVSDGLRAHIATEADWAPFVNDCGDGLPTNVVNSILAPLIDRSNLLDPDHDAFFDGPAVCDISGWDDVKARQPTSRFLPEIPTGTNLAHFNHTSDNESSLCVTCLLKSRFVDAAFARGGLGPSLSRNLLATISGPEPRYATLNGRSLLETLLLNLIVGDHGRPSWVAIHTSQQNGPGPIARMSWRPRLVMIAEDSETDRPCVHCGTVDRSRFAQAVMVDTYNHRHSPFGAKNDLDNWKTVDTDPHLLPFDKQALSIGGRYEEWPLRVLARFLGGTANASSSGLLSRAATLARVHIVVTSSAGNQAKIDDAPHAELGLPQALLARSESDGPSIADALAFIFHKSNHSSRERLIPNAVPQLLCELSVTTDPEAAVATWLQQEAHPARPAAQPGSTPESPRSSEATDSEHSDPLMNAAQQLIKRIQVLSPRERAVLRPPGQGGTNDPAARQHAFELIWYGARLPSGSRQFAVREALATVAPLLALFPNAHSSFQPPFVELLRRSLNSEPGHAGNGSHDTTTGRLLARILVAAPESRDALLQHLVTTVIAGGSTRRHRRINFADLLVDIARWNAPRDPTPARWQTILSQQSHPVTPSN